METPTFSQDVFNEQPANNQRSRLRSYLIILLLLLGFLSFLYWLLTKPPEPARVPKSAGINWDFSIYGVGKDRLKSPNGVAVDRKSGNIYIADTGNNRVMVFNRRGNFLFKFGKPKTGIPIAHQKKALQNPLSISVDESNGNIYAASQIAGKISVFNKTGKFIRSIPMGGVAANRPIKVKVVGKKLYVANAGSILVTTLKGRLLQKWGVKGKLPRQFEYPDGFDFDKKGNLFISDSMNMRIQILNKKGALVGGIGEPTKSMNQSDRLFGLGLGLTLDDNQNIYVVDAFHHAIRVFDHNGKDLGEFGTQGRNDGEFNYPADIVYAGGSTFVIADKWNNRVQVIDVNLKAGAGAFSSAAATHISLYAWLLLGLLLLIIAWFIYRRYTQNRAEQRQAPMIS